jgi:hypothetical protein
MSEQFFWRVFAETGQVPYFGGSGVGLLPLLYGTTGPWEAAVCIGNPASPVEAWLRANTDAELFLFPEAPRGPGGLPESRPQGAWDAGAVPTIAGEEERDILQVGRIAFGLDARPGFYRVRPLDGVLGENPPRVGLMHLGSLEGAAPVVRGARRLLRRCRPAILVNREAPVEAGRGIPELAALASVLAEAGYTLYDSMLSPLRTPEEVSGALDLWHETVFLALPAGSGVDHRTLMRAYRMDPAAYRADAAEGIRLRADEIVGCRGLYPAEYWEDLCWRWTGPLPRASVPLPLGRPGRYRLSCRLLKVADDRVLDTLRLFVNGMPVEHTVQSSDHDIFVEGTVILKPANPMSLAELRFVHSETYSVNPDDPRRLGLARIEVGVERQQ